MAGRMGGILVTVKNLHIISVDPQTNEVLVSGAVPGKTGSMVAINRISAGSLKDLEKEVATAVMESDSEAAAAPSDGAKAPEENK